MDWTWLGVVCLVCLLAAYWFKPRKQEEAPAKANVGDITEETLAYYSGYDYMKPILVAIKGRVFDVTKAADQFGPGKPLHAYAGKEVARALAKGSTEEVDTGSAVTHDLGQEEAQRLEAATAEYVKLYDEVGQVVPMKELTLEQLSQHDGSDPSKPLYLAIQGVVFNVSRGRQFYGPDGVYPFAGRECARALALISTEVSDCNGKVDDLGYVEQENLRDWTAKFRFKYPIVGKIVKEGAGGKQ